jgi:hypothetical protein
MEVKPWDELAASLSKNHGRPGRRALKRAEADGVRCELVAADDAGEAAQRLVTVFREQWRGNPLPGTEYWTRRFESHLEAAARRMLARGWGAYPSSGETERSSSRLQWSSDETLPEPT